MTDKEQELNKELKEIVVFDSEFNWNFPLDANTVDQIITIIKRYCLLRGERELPEYDFTGTPTFFESGYNIAQQEMLTPDDNGEYFGAVKEWE